MSNKIYKIPCLYQENIINIWKTGIWAVCGKVYHVGRVPKKNNDECFEVCYTFMFRNCSRILILYFTKPISLHIFNCWYWPEFPFTLFTLFLKCQNMVKKVLISSMVHMSNMEHGACSSRLSVSMRVLVNSINNFYLPYFLSHPAAALIGR